MATHTESRFIQAPRERVFDLVADVERYPDFLPLWIDARIYRRHGNTYHTEQEIGLGPIRERFHTRTVLDRPSRIEVTSTDGLFRAFTIRWDFADVPGGCHIDIALTWEVQSRLPQKAIDSVLPATAAIMVSAFEDRTRETAR